MNSEGSLSEGNRDARSIQPITQFDILPAEARARACGIREVLIEQAFNGNVASLNRKISRDTVNERIWLNVVLKLRFLEDLFGMELEMLHESYRVPPSAL